MKSKSNDDKKENLLENEDSRDEPNTSDDATAPHGTMQTIAGVMGNVLEW